MNLVLKYTFFAAIATVINLGTQELVLRSYVGMYAIALSILAGTATGLITKYVLDKKFIFYHSSKTAIQNSKTFTLYAFTGVFTTLIFWGFEVGFEFLFHDKTIRFLGATLGLSIGYFLKYRLDKKYVFRSDP